MLTVSLRSLFYGPVFTEKLFSISDYFIKWMIYSGSCKADQVGLDGPDKGDLGTVTKMFYWLGDCG